MDKTAKVLRAARLLLGVARFSDPRTAVLGCALALGRLVRTHCPGGLDTVLGVVRESYEGTR